MRNRFVAIKVLHSTETWFDLYTEKKRKDGSTYTQKHVGQIQRDEWIAFIMRQHDYLRLNGLLPGIPAATLAERFKFEEEQKRKVQL